MKQASRDSEAGFTLVEMLVVIAVIGVATGAAMIGLGGRGQSAETEAVRLARHLNLAVDEALIGGLPLALRWDSSGYSFSQMLIGSSDVEPLGWVPAASALLRQRHDLANRVQLRLRGVPDSAPVILPASLVRPAITFEIEDAGRTWTVTYDGFAAIALPEDQS